MMKSYTLNNWDGQLSNSEPQTTQNLTKDENGSNTWESRSHALGSPSGHPRVRNGAPIADNEMMDRPIKQTYVETMANITNDVCNDGQNTCLLEIKDHGTMLDNVFPVNLVEATLADERKDASVMSQSTTRTFVPVENSLLHAFHAHTAPTSPHRAKKLEAVLFAPPSPIPQKDFDVISLHNTDAEGEDEDDDAAAAVIQLLISPTKLNEPPQSRVLSPTYSGHNSLFSPRPSEGLPSSDHLFTPEPLPPKPAPTLKRERTMYVDVPTLLGPKSEYRWMLPLPRRPKKPRPPVPAVMVYQNLQDALQASIDNNTRGVQATTTTTKKKKKEGHKKPQNAVAGSSKHPIVLDSVSSASSVYVPTTKKRVQRDDEVLQDSKKKQKRTHVDIDLTLSDGESPVAVPKLKPKLLRPKANLPRVVPAHDKENDAITTLVLDVVKPIDFQIWDLNTRFLRASVMQRKKADSSTPFVAEPELLARRKTETLSREKPWFCRIPSQPSLDEDEISLGGTILTSWDAAGGSVLEEESDDDEIIFLEPHQIQQQQQQQHLGRPPASVSSSSNVSRRNKPPLPRKIDLAARYRKKVKTQGGPNPIVSKHSSQPHIFGLKPISPSSSFSTQAQPHFDLGPSLSNNQFVEGEFTAQLDQNTQREALGPSTPSAKALGKRKAVNAEPYDTHLSLRSFGFPSSHRDPTHLQDATINSSSTLEHFRKPNPDIFIHNYDRSPSPIFSSSTATAYANTQTLSSLYTPSRSLDGDISQFVPTFANVGEEGFVDPWDMGVGRDHQDYQCTTVDPTLLGGSVMVEPEHKPSEPLPDYAADFAPTDVESDADRDEMSKQSQSGAVQPQSGPAVGPSGVQNRSRSVSSSPSVTSPSVLEFPSSTENTLEREYVPSNASTFERPKRKKPALASFYVSSSDDDEPFSNLVARKHKERGLSSSSMPSDKVYVRSTKLTVERDSDISLNRKTRRASSSSSSFYVAEDLPEIVYVPSTTPASKRGPLPKAKKHSYVNEETSSDKEYVPPTKLSLQHNPPPKRKTGRASSSSFHDDNNPGIERVPSTTPAVQPEDASLQKKNQTQSSSEVALRSLPKRQRVQRQREDFINIDVYLEAEGSGTGSSIVGKIGVVAKPAQKTGAMTEVKRVNHEDWAKEEVDSYCHQCRNKTFIRKMVCPSCSTKFCFRCLSGRYPDKSFFEGAQVVWTKDCPRCEKFCNCTICCGKRGEQYVSSRRPPGKRISVVSTPTPAPIPAPAPSPMRKVQFLSVAPPVLLNNAQYWGTMYDLNGRRLGVTYASGGDLPSVGFAMPSTSKTVAIKRVFVGSVQRSWGFARQPAISDLKPLPRSKPVKLTKGKKIKNQPKMRHFIGSDKFLRYRKKSEPYDPFGELSSLSSLTSDDEDEDTPEEPETDVEVFNPESLTDRDVCRAIALSLQACGLRIVVNGPAHTLITSL